MKKFLLFVSSCFGFVLAQAQQGPFSGNTFSTSSIASFSQGWTSASNAASSDNNYASFGNLPNPSGTYTNYLVATGFNFNIPAGALVSGIVVEIERSDPNGLTSDYSVRIVKNATIGATEKSTGQAYPLADAYQSYGGISDLWGETWSYKEITNANFGVAVAAQRNAAGGTTAGGIDHIRITVYYQYLVTLPVKLISFNAQKNNQAVYLKWITSAESAIEKYVVERSENNRDFIALGEVASLNSTTNATYTFTDNTSLKTTAWYRLRIVEQSGAVKYSPIVMLKFDPEKQHVIYPSLLQTGQTAYITGGKNQKLVIRMFGNNGQQVASVTTSEGQFTLPQQMLAGGTYYYKIFDSRDAITGAGKILTQ